MSGYWLEVSVETDREAAEAVSSVLAGFAYGGGVAIDESITPSPDGDGFAYNLERPVTVKAYLPADDRAGGNVEAMRLALDHLSFLRPIAPLRVRRLAEEDWANAWKEHYHVLRVGRRLVVVPSWRDHVAEPQDIAFRLDPGMAFGTGLHPSTRRCLERLEDLVRPGMTVLDVGTGSGILALAAARLGAASVLALDVDPVAVQAARDNVALNGLQHVITVGAGSLPLPAVARFDLVVANIIARVIRDLAADLAGALQPGGHLLTAGIIADQAASVEGRLLAAGLHVVERNVDGDWVALTLSEDQDASVLRPGGVTGGR